MAKVLIPLAEGFEEIEAMAIMDVLSRAGIEITVAGLSSLEVKGANTGLSIKVPVLLDGVDAKDYDMIVLPGGLPGSEHLAKSKKVKELLREFDAKNKIVGAICAAPLALNEAGVLKENYTCYPSYEKNIKKEGYTDKQKVIIDDNVMTSRGPGTAICFALEIVKKLSGEQKYNQLKAGLLADYC
jgi:4-methyl-5(b-hydroxyethyl)-thiazole monophosphate biosynthesis